MENIKLLREDQHSGATVESLLPSDERRLDPSWAGEPFKRLSAAIRKFGLTWSADDQQQLISWHISIFLVAAAIIFSRKPDVLMHAQFHSEDGKWFADAYNLGLRATLFFPYSGYLVVFDRLVGALSLLPPVSLAPLAMNVVGLIAQVLPVNFLLSHRCTNWGSLSQRGLYALAYLVLPSGLDLNVIATNGPWHLAFLNCLILLAKPAKGIAWQFSDVLITLLCGLSGPFGLILLPIAVMRYRWDKKMWASPMLIALVASCLMQGTVMLVFRAIHATYEIGGRVDYPNGASWLLFWKILGERVFLDALTGGRLFSLPPIPLVHILICLSAVSVIALAVKFGKKEIRYFLIFSFALLAFALKSSLMSSTLPQWQVLALVADCRYFFFAMLALVWVLIWCATSKVKRPLRAVVALPLLLLFCGVFTNWRYAADADLQFSQYAADLEFAPTGKVVRIPIYPGEPWVIYVRKH